jgi:hypothetical protein
MLWFTGYWVAMTGGRLAVPLAGSRLDEAKLLQGKWIGPHSLICRSSFPLKFISRVRSKEICI